MALHLGVAAEPAPVRIEFGNAPVNEVFVGNGVQWSAYPHADAAGAEWGAVMTPAKWEMVFERLDYMRPKVVRVMDYAHWRYYKGLDDSGNPIVDFDTEEMRSLCRLLDYCQRRGIGVMIGEWGTPDNGRRSEGIVRADDPRWSRMICRFLTFLTRDKGYDCIRWYNLVNEPNGDWATTDGDWNQWRRGYTMLHAALERAGLSDRIALAGPDVVANYDHKRSPVRGRDWVRLTADSLSSVTGVYDVHPYPDQNTIRSGAFYDYYKSVFDLTRNNPKPFLFGELGLKYKGGMGQEQRRRAKADPLASENDSQMFVYEYFYGIDMADALIQSMCAGFSGAMAWDLDDAMHTEGDTGDKTRLKRWGMWNSLGTEFGDPKDEALRPWFYPWSLMCRYFLPGMKIYEPKSFSVAGVRAVMGRSEAGYTVALLNSSEQPRSVVVAADGPRRLKMRRYRYSEAASPRDGSGFPRPEATLRRADLSRGVPVELPARSFVLLTNLKID